MLAVLKNNKSDVEEFKQTFIHEYVCASCGYLIGFRHFDNKRLWAIVVVICFSISALLFYFAAELDNLEELISKYPYKAQKYLDEELERRRKYGD